MKKLLIHPGIFYGIYNILYSVFVKRRRKERGRGRGKESTDSADATAGYTTLVHTHQQQRHSHSLFLPAAESLFNPFLLIKNNSLE